MTDPYHVTAAAAPPPIRLSAAALLVLLVGLPASAQPPTAPSVVTAVNATALRYWDRLVDQGLRAGDLRRYASRPNPWAPARHTERFAQYHLGIPVYGADLVRQTEAGVTTAIFGTRFADIEIDTTPGLTPAEARAVFDELAGPGSGLRDPPSLWVFPRGEGAYTLAWRGVVADFRDVFIDADTGETLFQASRLHHQSIGLGTGLLGDLRKMATDSVGGAHLTRDRFRPAELHTLDMQRDHYRLLTSLIGLLDGGPVSWLDYAADDDNRWDDGAVVDVHAGMGWTYDYLFKELGWAGIDGANGPVTAFVHPLDPDAVLREQADCLANAENPLEDCGIYLFLLALIDNAAYLPPLPGSTGTGFMFFGEPHELPRPLTALDIVAHEMAHGVTYFTAGLANTPPPNEPGAINEAFSDIIGTAVEFHVQPAGAAPLRADYLMGEDSGFYIRSLRDPQELATRFGPYPDHYDALFRGEEDFGGVHINATILGHAYFLAIEGGVNRTSGLPVTGVGHENRGQIEQIFFNAWVGLLPSFADHGVAAQSLVQSARDLFGADADPTRAITEALRAVGVLP